MEFKIIVEKGEDGFVARCPALKGCWSQGKTAKEALQNIKEAVQLYLEPDPKDFPRRASRSRNSRKIKELIIPPLISGQEVVRVFERIGYYRVSQGVSHIKIRNDITQTILIIPDHERIYRYTLKGIFKDAGNTLKKI